MPADAKTLPPIHDIGPYSRFSERVHSVCERFSKLKRADAAGITFVARGDDGGQVYFTLPASYMSCTPARLKRLLFDVDFVNWRDPSSISIFLREIEDSDGILWGGMGGGLVTGSFWIHDTMRGSIFARRIEEVLYGERPGVWSSRPQPLYVPPTVHDLMNMLEDESGDAPVFGLTRAAARLLADANSEKYSRRFSGILRRLLGAQEARNRVEAAWLLLGKVENSSLVCAVESAATGTIVFPPWGMWRKRASYILGVAVRANDVRARSALIELSKQDGWIEECGPYALAEQHWFAIQERYFNPEAFRAEWKRRESAD